MKLIGVVSLALFVATIPFANWLVEEYGLVSVGFGLMAPAAVYAVGLALILRDVAHRTLGRWWTVGGILVGSVLSLILAEPLLALASGVAFFVSEMLDLGVYEPLRKRGWTLAMVCSNIVGAASDSALFLWLAPMFGLEFFWGQFVGKLTMTVVAVGLIVVVAGGRRAVLARSS